MYVKTIDYRSPQAAEEFVDTLRETGFAVLSNHPISYGLVESVYKEWEDFFGNDKKSQYLFDPKTTRQAGYFPFKSENAKGYPASDLKEFYHYRDEQDLPEGISTNTQILLNDLSVLANEVLLWAEKKLPSDLAQNLSMPLNQMIQNSDMTLLRILHYPPLNYEEEEECVRAAAHEDIVLLTILPAATAPGLQVMDSKGVWHEVACDPGALVFNAGDMLQMATNGFYKSTTHRVVNPLGEDALKSRYSMPLFLHPRREVRLSSTHTAREYLDERLAEIGLKKQNQAA
jgi:isopenicillin N synthase-like dioxygenase